MRRECSEDNNMLTNRGSRWKDTFSRHLQTDGANERPGLQEGSRKWKWHDWDVVNSLRLGRHPQSGDFIRLKQNLCKPQGRHFSLIWPLSPVRRHQQLRDTRCWERKRGRSVSSLAFECMGFQFRWVNLLQSNREYKSRPGIGFMKTRAERIKHCFLMVQQVRTKTSQQQQQQKD